MWEASEEGLRAWRAGEAARTEHIHFYPSLVPGPQRCVACGLRNGVLAQYEAFYSRAVWRPGPDESTVLDEWPTHSRATRAEVVVLVGFMVVAILSALGGAWTLLSTP